MRLRRLMIALIAHTGCGVPPSQQASERFEVSDDALALMHIEQRDWQGDFLREHFTSPGETTYETYYKLSTKLAIFEAGNLNRYSMPGLIYAGEIQFSGSLMRDVPGNLVLNLQVDVDNCMSLRTISSERREARVCRASGQ